MPFAVDAYVQAFDAMADDLMGVKRGDRVGSPAPASSGAQRETGQRNVLQLANVVRGLSPMNSAADQISPLGSAMDAV